MDDMERFAVKWTMGFGNMNDALFGRDEPLPPRKRAIKSDWKTHRMPRTRAHFDLGMHLTEEQFEELAWGHIPEVQEDHWFMYFDGEAFNFVRSWTGFTVYRVYVERDEQSGYTLTRVTANRSSKQFLETNDERDAIMVRILVGQALDRDVDLLWQEYLALDEGR